MILLVFPWKIGYISVQDSPISIPRPVLERILNFRKMFKWSKQDLRTIKWSTEAPKSPEGETSSTWVKRSIRRKSNREILMSIYMVLWEAIGLFKLVQAKNSWKKKFCSSFSDRNNLNFYCGRPCLTNRMGANFFLWKYLILSHFLIFKTPTELPYHAISAEISFHSTCIRLREIRLFLLLSKSLRVESMNYCFKSPPPKFQPQIRSKIAHLIKKVKQGFHSFIWKIKKLLIFLNSKGMFDHNTQKYRLFKCF
jgi:hypothetical protein